jgi:hypothetical protein
MAVAVRNDPSFAASKPEVVFEKRYFMSQGSSVPGRTYDISRDGGRFLMIKEDENLLKELVLVQNWFEELKRVAPAN